MDVELKYGTIDSKNLDGYFIGEQPSVMADGSRVTNPTLVLVFSSGVREVISYPSTEEKLRDADFKKIATSRAMKVVPD
jgi:hypothetical protein